MKKTTNLKKILFFSLLELFFCSNLYCCIFPYQTPTIKHLKKIEIEKSYSGLKGVDCIYVINLDARPSKWERVKKLFLERNLYPNRVSAINGWKLSSEERQELAGPYPERLSGGHIGCLLSHISILADAYNRGFNLIWITEDDIEFVGNIQKIPQILEALNHLDPLWDIFYTDMDSKDEKGNRVKSVGFDFRPDQQYFPLEHYLQRKKINEEIMKIGQRFGTYSLFVSKQGIQKIMHYFTHVYLWTPIDIDIHYIPGIREYASRSEIVTVWCGSGASDTKQPLK